MYQIAVICLIVIDEKYSNKFLLISYVSDVAVFYVQLIVDECKVWEK